jgi:predicted transcriptional regulator
MTKTRDTIAICVEVLQAVQRYPNFSRSRVLSYCGLNASTTQRHVRLLLESGLLRIEKRQKGEYGYTFKVTVAGSEWLQRASEVLSALSKP